VFKNFVCDSLLGIQTKLYKSLNSGNIFDSNVKFWVCLSIQSWLLERHIYKAQIVFDNEFIVVFHAYVLY
jgi:hypothetical protein